MKNLVTIQNVKGYLDENGVAYLHLEDVARGLGFVETKNDKEYVMWRRVESYLSESGFFGTSAEREFYPRKYIL